MTITINTNLASIIARKNLSKATDSLDTAIERMTTGYKINHASDNAAGYAIARNWEVQLSSLDVAADNAAIGADMMTTLEDNYSLISSHLQRVRDLTEQASNGSYGSDSLRAIKSEVTARLEEIDRISKNCEFNGIDLMSGTVGTIDIQVGLYSDSNSQIELDSNLFKKGTVSALFAYFSGDSTLDSISDVAIACSGINASNELVTNPDQHAMLDKIDKVIKEISIRTTKLGAAQNRIDSAIESIDVQSENITSSLSTLRDADIAEESSKYIQAQILQEAASTLLATANQMPSIALNLI